MRRTSPFYAPGINDLGPEAIMPLDAALDAVEQRFTEVENRLDSLEQESFCIAILKSEVIRAYILGVAAGKAYGSAAPELNTYDEVKRAMEDYFK